MCLVFIPLLDRNVVNFHNEGLASFSIHSDIVSNVPIPNTICIQS